MKTVRTIWGIDPDFERVEYVDDNGDPFCNVDIERRVPVAIASEKQQPVVIEPQALAPSALGFVVLVTAGARMGVVLCSVAAR